jgi:hypothetical protein
MSWEGQEQAAQFGGTQKPGRPWDPKPDVGRGGVPGRPWSQASEDEPQDDSVDDKLLRVMLLSLKEDAIQQAKGFEGGVDDMLDSFLARHLQDMSTSAASDFKVSLPSQALRKHATYRIQLQRSERQAAGENSKSIRKGRERSDNRAEARRAPTEAGPHARARRAATRQRRAIRRGLSGANGCRAEAEDRK